MNGWVWLLFLAGTIALILVEGLASGGVGGWLDARASNTREEVLDDLTQYGADSPGIRSELLTADERQQVLAARRRRRDRWRWRWRPAG